MRSRQSAKARSSRNSSGPDARGPIASGRAQVHVEQVRHRGGLCDAAAPATSSGWSPRPLREPVPLGARFRASAALCRMRHDRRRSPQLLPRLLDAGRVPRRTRLRDAADMPLQATEADDCAACLAKPPRIARTRAAVAYGELSRSLAIRLKYGRKVAIARTMARYMAPLVAQRSATRCWSRFRSTARRLWQRGFNQSALVARELSRRLRLRSDLPRSEANEADSALKGMSPLQRRNDRGRRLRVPRRTGRAGQDRDPDRRCSDDRQHGGGVRTHFATRRRDAGRTDQLGARCASDAVDALKACVSIPAKERIVPVVEIYTKTFCPYCWRAKLLLEGKGVEYRGNRRRFRR